MKKPGVTTITTAQVTLRELCTKVDRLLVCMLRCILHELPNRSIEHLLYEHWRLTVFDMGDPNKRA